MPVGLMLWGVLASLPGLWGATTHRLEYALSPADNPLKGFVAYPGPNTTFPHSLIWNYLPLRSLMTGPTNFDWTPLESELRSAASQGRQFIPRIHLDFPGQPIAIPQFLIDAGVRVFTWTNTNTQPWPPAISYTPDYRDSRLRAALTNFIHALGTQYDGDPRLAYVPMGLLGTWGEWHNSPRDELFASKTVQREVMDAYATAFRRTRILARYPAGPNDFVYASNHQRAIGYHDDSFAWATMETGRTGDAWFFRARLISAGAVEKWREHPIGGEVRPEVWNCLWDTPTCAPSGQDFNRCATNTHATWLANHGVFEHPLQGEPLERALAGARLLGYEFHVPWVTVGESFTGAPLRIRLAVTNSGIAPFYYEWPIELGAVDTAGQLAATWSTIHRLTRIQPGGPEAIWEHTVTNLDLAAGDYVLAVRAAHPLPNGKPLQFANVSQNQDRWGWLSLCPLEVKPRPQLRCELEGPRRVRIELENHNLDVFKLESTTNLIEWLPAGGSSTSALRIDATEPWRFFRLATP